MLLERAMAGCETKLLRFLEDGKSTLLVAILMVLSKAFDCLPHNILLSKLPDFGQSSQPVKLL